MSEEKKRYLIKWTDKEPAAVKSLQGHMMIFSPNCSYYRFDTIAEKPQAEEKKINFREFL